MARNLLLVLSVLILSLDITSAEIVILQSGRRVKINEDFTWEEILIDRTLQEPITTLNHNGVLIEAVDVRVINTYSDQRKAGIQFRLRNNSDKTVSKLRVRVYYINKDGQFFFDKDYTLVDSNAYIDRNILRPNYSLRLPSGNTYYTVDGLIIEEWAVGKIVLDLLTLEFE